MTNDELLALLEGEERDAAYWSEIQDDRTKAMDYYLSRPYGNEVEGRSAVVTSEVRDTVEWALPALLRIFTSSDKAVQFDPQGPEDEEGAKQATDAANYVFYRQNNGFLVLYSMFKDALLQKTGAVKWWWDKKVTYEPEKYRGLTDDQMSMLLMNEGIQVVAHSAYPDPQAAMMQGMSPSMLHDIDIRIPKDGSKVCIAPIPPEELLVARRHNSVLLADCPYVAHVSRKTLSELREAGFDVSEDDLDDSAWPENSEERQARNDYWDHRSEREDKASRYGWVREEYVLVDYDDDGFAERRKIVRTGTKILLNEECDHIPIGAITPIILTHRFCGMSVADAVMDLQLLSSTIWRQMLDNLYHANNQRVKVLASPDGRVQANVDDVLNSRPGGIIREYTPGAVTPMATPWVGGQAFPMLEYIDQQRVNRSGVNYLSSGLDADTINKTARGATMAQNMMQERIELIARVFAETGVKEIFRGILYLMTRYSTKPLMMRLRNEFVTYDPRSWKTSYDLVANVGLGTGNRDQQLMHLNAMAQSQLAMLQTPFGRLVSPKNAFNVQARIAENAGFNNAAEFWTDPDTAQTGQPGLDPQAMEAVQMLQSQIAQLQQQLADKSVEQQLKAQEVRIKGYAAETDRIEAVPPITAEQVQALVMQTLQQALNSPDPSMPQ